MSAAIGKEVVEITKISLSECALGKLTEGKTFAKPMSEYDKPLGMVLEDLKFAEGLVKTDDNGKVYIDDKGNLIPDTDYILNNNKYKTDENGNTTKVDGELAELEDDAAVRNNDAQRRAGGEDRKPNDHGGHIIARVLGGSGEMGNIIAMDSHINLSDYKNMEKEIISTLKADKRVKFHAEISYSDGSKRPDKIIIKTTIDGKDTVYKFDNNIDGSLRDSLKETCNESDIARVDRTCEKTGGEISSIKEEYDANGNLEKTTVTITSVNENGDNQRDKVTINHQGGAE